MCKFACLNIFVIRLVSFPKYVKVNYLHSVFSCFLCSFSLVSCNFWMMWKGKELLCTIFCIIVSSCLLSSVVIGQVFHRSLFYILQKERLNKICIFFTFTNVSNFRTVNFAWQVVHINHEFMLFITDRKSRKIVNTEIDFE